MTNKNIVWDANKALGYDAKKIIGGGYKLGHTPSSYGIALKWLIHMRDMRYSDFGKRYNGTTGQNVNNFINRVNKKRFEQEDIDKICSVLRITPEYFYALVEQIEKVMRQRNENTV